MATISATTALTVATEHGLLNHVFRNVTHTPASSVYVMCLTAAPDDSGTFTEVTGGSYARQALSATVAASRGNESVGDINFTATSLASTAWAATTAKSLGDRVVLSTGEALEVTVAGTTDTVEPTAPAVGATVVDGTVTWEHIGVTWIGLIDDPTTGTLIAAGPVDTPVDPAGDDLVIPAGGLKNVIANVFMTDYLANELLDHLYRSESYSPTATVESALYDETDAEFTGGTYARQTVSFGAAASSEVANDTAYAHTGLPAATWAASKIHEDTNGPALYVLAPSAPKSLTAGSSLTFAIGSTKCGLS